MDHRDLKQVTQWRLAGGADEVSPPSGKVSLPPGKVSPPSGNVSPPAGDEEPLPLKKKVQKFLKNNRLIILLIGAVIFGLVIGFLLRLRRKPYTKREVMYASLMGVLLIRMLQCITIPLFTTSIMTALGQLDMKTSEKIGFMTIAYFIATSFISTLVGIILVIILQPGASKQQTHTSLEIRVRPTFIVDNMLDIARNMFPPNFIEAWLYTHITVLTPPEENSSLPIKKWDFQINQLQSGPNFMGLVIGSVVVGFAMGYLQERVEEFAYVVETINDTFTHLTFWIIKISPPGICCLIIGQIIELKDVSEAIVQLGMYIACCIIGLLIISLVIIPSIYYFFLRKSPIPFLYDSIIPVVTAFATSSSIATMPTTLKCVEELRHVDPRISRFVIPLGTTANMNGAALYTTVGPLFLAQLADIDINLGHYIALSFIATMTAVGSAAVPQGGIIAMVMVLSVLHVPPTMIGIAYTADWLLDRCNTSVNILGDIAAAEIIEHLNRQELAENLLHKRHHAALI